MGSANSEASHQEKKTMKTTQEKRQATMKRLSASPAKRYDTRQHRRATRVALKWQREMLAGSGLDAAEISSLQAGLCLSAQQYTHRRFKGPRLVAA